MDGCRQDTFNLKSTQIQYSVYIYSTVSEVPWKSDVFAKSAGEKSFYPCENLQYETKCIPQAFLRKKVLRHHFRCLLMMSGSQFHILHDMLHKKEPDRQQQSL